MDTSFLATRMAAHKAGELPLATLLFEELPGRGPLPPEQHAAELAWLVQECDAGSFEPGVVQQVVERLQALQAADEPTRVSAEVPAAAGADEATRVAPAAASAALPDQATIVQPRSTMPPDGPATRTGTAPHATHATGSVDASGWRQVADAAGGDRAAVGMLLKGRFLLEREIGRGGMGVVFLARDERKVEARDRDPYVAVKVLNDEFRRHPDSLIALQRESRRSQQLAHDNIVRVYDFDKDGTIVFMTMEYVDGSDLRTLIRERAFKGLPLAQARPLIEGMARALKRAHDAGVVHSDFKPGNVMVTREGVPKVFDFGIARAGKQPGEPAEDQTVFDAGKLGALTPAYASLEMIHGKPPQPTDDIYALGCVAFELLTGKHPFDKVSAEVAMRERRRPPAVRGLSRRQYRSLCDAVAFTSDKRLASADRLVEGLREVGLRERVGRPLAYAAAALLLLLAGGGFALGKWHARRVAEVAAGFLPGTPARYLDEAQAGAALARLDDEERRRLMLEQGEQVQQFLLDRVDAHWNPDQGRRDYAGAQQVFALAAQWHLFLPRLDLRRAAIDKERHDLEQAALAVAAGPSAPAPSAAPGAPSPATGAPSPSTESNAAAPPVAPAEAPQPRPAATEAADSALSRMQEVAAGLLREGERNFARQNFSAAIANARAALQVSPGDPRAKRLLRRAQQAQEQAMNSISIN